MPQSVFAQHQGPYRMFGLDHDVRNDVGSDPIDVAAERQGEGSPQGHANGVGSSLHGIHVQTCLKAAEPERRGKQLERAEHVPQKILTEAVIFDCAKTGRWTPKGVWMMRRDDDLLANGLDSLELDGS